MFRLQSLRTRALVVICLVVVAPVVFVWVASPFEDALGAGLKTAVERAVTESDTLARTDAPRADYVEVAERFGVWLRVLEADGRVVQDVDETEPTFRDRLLFFPDRVPDFADFDATLPRPARRTVVREALTEGRHGSCGYADEGGYLVCTLARRVRHATTGEPRVIYAVAATPRALTSLYDERYHLLKLMLLVLIVAVGLGVWLGIRIGRPLERLRDQVLERVGPPVSTTPIESETDDEFGQLSDAFNELLSSLQARRRANEEFMADMAHEIKNPVAAIRAAAERLSRGDDVPADRAARLANILHDSSRRLDGVVNQFLELARAESGLPGAEREELRVDRLVANLVDSYRDDAQYADVEFGVDVSEATAHASPEHAERALRNLIENAASFAGSRVDVLVRHHIQNVVVEVADDGPGIPKEDLPKVFERFFTRRDDGGGTGLGLAMARAVVEAHGGDIDVDSTPGRGTTFRVALPAV